MTNWPDYNMPKPVPVEPKEAAIPIGEEFFLFPKEPLRTRDFHALPPKQPNAIGDEYYSLPITDIPVLAAEYIKWLELATTKEACTCEWIIHPDDLKIRADHCRICQHPRSDHQDPELSEDDSEVVCQQVECRCIRYMPRRLRRGEASLDCPVHTREGLVIGFFQWAFRDHVRSESQEPQDVDTGN